VPDSGISAAIGYAEEAGIPYAEGLIKNRYIGRTFIQPNQNMRETSVKIKLNPIRKVLAGKRVVVIDDSIVRGTTSAKIVQMIREAGAIEVHMRITSPPVRFPCHFGIDTQTSAELIANSHTTTEIQEAIGADTLGYLSQEGLFRVSGLRMDEHCAACFDGDYPMAVDSVDHDKLIFEKNTEVKETE
jgi:amidophosphoribosyltransferase